MNFFEYFKQCLGCVAGSVIRSDSMGSRVILDLFLVSMPAQSVFIDGCRHLVLHSDIPSCNFEASSLILDF